MITNRIYRYLCFGVGLFAAMWTYIGLRDLYNYWKLDSRTEGIIQAASIHQRSSSSFDILATYTYIVDGESYSATTSLGKPYQLNPYSAEKAANKIVRTARHVYYQRNQPEISALIRQFPYKSVLQAGLTWGICIYLWILNLYHTKQARGDRETKR
jgi:hypothetical protein